MGAMDPLGMVMIEDDPPDPVTVAPDADPLAVLRTMAKFLPGQERGIAEIRDGDKLIGIAALQGHPERLPMPVYDAATREVACVELTAWLKARGHEASACKWERRNPMNMPTQDPAVRWILRTGEAAVPQMPPTHKENQAVQFNAQRAMTRQEALGVSVISAGRGYAPTFGSLKGR